MAYNKELAARVRTALVASSAITEKKMFGGLSFLLGGKMCCGVIDDNLVVRVGPDGYEDALAQPNARPMDFTGRPMAGWVYVAPEGHLNDESLAGWVMRGLDFAASLQRPARK